MAIEKGVENIDVTTQERTWRVELFVDYGTMPRLVAHRELVKTSGGNLISREPAGTVTRTMDQIANKDLGGGLTGAEMAQAIADAIDLLRTEDLAKEFNP